MSNNKKTKAKSPEKPEEGDYGKKLLGILGKRSMKDFSVRHRREPSDDDQGSDAGQV